MPFIEQAIAAALISGLFLVVGPAKAEPGTDGLAQSPAHLEGLQRDVGRPENFVSLAPAWGAAATSEKAMLFQAAPSGYSGVIADLMTPAAIATDIVAVVPQAQPNSAVPLPTGLSMFGAALLALGLFGFVSGAQRSPVLEVGRLPQRDHSPLEADPAPWFKIEIRAEGRYQVHRMSSARGAIDLIADLLNEGWDVVRISDRTGQSIDYDDVIHAWRHERQKG